MKKLKNKLFLAISVGTSIIIFAAIYFLKEQGIIQLPNIESIRLYSNHDYALGSPEFFNLPRPYSRFWDLLIFPGFIALLFWSGKKSWPEANPWIIGVEILIIITLSYLLASGVVALGAASLFVVVCGIVFGEWTGIFGALSFGLIVGLAAFGLLFGFIISILSYALFLGIRKIVA